MDRTLDPAPPVQPHDATPGYVPAAEPITAQRPLARVQALPWMLVIGLLAAVAFLGWRAFFHKAEGDPVASAMFAFQKQNSLTVLSSRFDVLAESVYTRSLGPIELNSVKQAAIMPATVEYRLDLSNMDRDAFRWDAGSRTLDVTLPALRISQPNIDEKAARTFTDGVLNSGGSQQQLSRNNSAQAERKASAFAQNPQVLLLARQAAKEAVRQNLAIPLQVAGFEDAKVTVRFAGETPAG